MPIAHFEETSQRMGHYDLDGNTRYTRTFQVLMDFTTDGADQILQFGNAAAGGQVGILGDPFFGNPSKRCPQPGEKYVRLNDVWEPVFTNEHSVCIDVRAEQHDEENLRNWTVIAEYAGAYDPESQPAELAVVKVPYQVAITQDLTRLDTDLPGARPTGKPVLNSADDFFAEGLVVDRHRTRLVISKNIIDFRPDFWEPYQDSVNAGVFLTGRLYQGFAGFAQGTCKLTFEAERVRRSGNTDFYWRLKLEIDVKNMGWQIEVRDAGFNFKPVGLGVALGKVPFHGVFGGVSPSFPQLLKPSGDRVRPGDPIPPPLKFTGYEVKDWTPLGIEDMLPVL